MSCRARIIARMQRFGTDPPIDEDPHHALARGLRQLERVLDRGVGAAANPLRQLGALATGAFWICVATGAYVYIGFDTSADGAWRSVRALEQHPIEGVIKSLHRYSSFAFIGFTLLHLAAEWVHGRYRAFRWFSWVTGLIPLWLGVACATVGYWLIADTRAQYVASGLGEWIGALPGVGAGLMRNFITDEAISDRLLSLIIFLHIGVGLLLLLGLWVHLARLVRPRTWPVRSAGLALVAALVALSVFAPALSGPRADFARVPDPIAVDWLAYGLLPLMHATTPAAAWAAVGAATLLIATLPWFGARRTPPQAAVVDAANCNGCRRCFDDCPYGAVVMAPHPTRHLRQIAVVVADQCAACGICVGACPSATPFRSVDELVTGIDLPQRPLDALRRRLSAALAGARAASVRPIIVFGCDHGADVTQLAGATTIAVSLPCSAALPPAFADFVQREGAAAVLMADCGAHGCAYRTGSAVTRARLQGRREPHLHAQARARVSWVDAAAGEERAVRAALAALRATLQEPTHV